MPTDLRLDILLVDDDEDDRELFISAINTVPGQALVSSLTNGQDLMADLKARNPDMMPHVIILDLNMPFKGGKECLEEIRADEALRKIPVVIYSTTRSDDQIEDLYKRGADYYICKPSSFPDIMKVAQLICSMTWGEHTKRLREEFVLYNDTRR